MTNKFKVNIDTVVFNVTGMKFNIPEATKATVTSADGVVLNSFHNRTAIRNKYGTHALHVSTANMGGKLIIQGSPFAFHYGQNLFTSSNLLDGCIKSLIRVCNHFGFRPTNELKQAWREGDINLDRVDLPVDFSLGSDELVLNTLKQLKRQIIERPTTVRICGTSVSWSPRDGVEFCIVFYAKGPQIRQLKRYKKAPFREKLGLEAEGVLRLELRLKRGVLRKLGLDKVSAWSKDTPNELIEIYLKKLNFLNVTSGELSKDDLASCNSKLKPILALHKLGVDLASVYEKRTLQRYQAQFRALGIDIKCPNKLEAASVVSLPEMLSYDKSIKSSPKWMRQAKLVPPVKTKKRKL
jgi:hypothetical protein